MPARAFAWAMAAGSFALGALIAVWLVIGQLVKVPGNPTADYGHYSLVVVVPVIAMASLQGAVTEELGLRGYMLTRLESQVSGWVAVVIVAVAIAPGHGMTQGFDPPTLLWYFVADVVFGSMAVLARSILPGMLVHLVGLLAFFSVVWPTDRYRHPASLGEQGHAFWIEVGAFVALAVISFLAFRRLASTMRQSPDHSIEDAGDVI